ncbi:MAG: N-acetylmuramoyl-L-alanine amidase [Lachnospiraceae bacterium]|nr:N-acetylmuramoyl-L-alanine amidase [Lachnospiraceae bacterium]
MANRIIMDAGHGGRDNGASYGDRIEKEDNLAMTLAVGKILEEMGFDVVYTREEDIYQAPFRKATIANEAGGDLFVSIHRNSSEIANQYQGVETLVYSEGGFPQEVANNINNELEKVGYINLGIEERPRLVVLNSTQMPAVLVEVGFINSDDDNQLFENKFEETANAIAEGIAMSFLA